MVGSDGRRGQRTGSAQPSNNTNGSLGEGLQVQAYLKSGDQDKQPGGQPVLEEHGFCWMEEKVRGLHTYLVVAPRTL